MWAASRARLPRAAPGAEPVLGSSGAVSLAGMLDLVAADAADIGGDAVRGFLGGRAEQVPDRYAVASPIALPPAEVPVVCVHGVADTDVPLRQSQDYTRTAGTRARLRTVDGAGHLDLITLGSAGWRAGRDETLNLPGM